MSVLTAPSPERLDTATESNHVVCETCMRRLCSGEVETEPLVEWFDDPNGCVVCDDLDEIETCVHCGAPPP